MSAAPLLATVGIEPRHWRVGTQYLPCPQCKRDRRDDRLTLWIRADDSCGWFCNRCGWKGGSTVCGQCGRVWAGCRCERRKPEPAREPDRARQLERARALWRSSLEITANDIAGRYLLARGCRLPHPEGHLRWHQRVRHSRTHIGPALVAKLTWPAALAEGDDGDLELVTVHRTWLKPDGSDKTDLERPRLVWWGIRDIAGVCCRLWPDRAVTQGLGLGEGIESALALAQGFEPVWAAINARNLELFPHLSGVGCVTLAPDYDLIKQGRRTGVEAAIACGRRWHEAGAEVCIVPPDKEGTDMADVARAVRDAIRQEGGP
jgi:hypothetical protein